MMANGSDEELAALSSAPHTRSEMFARVTIPNAKSRASSDSMILCTFPHLRRVPGPSRSSLAGRDGVQTICPSASKPSGNPPGGTPAAFALASLLTLLALVTLVAKTLIRMANLARGSTAKASMKLRAASLNSWPAASACLLNIQAKPSRCW